MLPTQLERKIVRLERGTDTGRWMTGSKTKTQRPNTAIGHHTGIVIAYNTHMVLYEEFYRRAQGFKHREMKRWEC